MVDKDIPEKPNKFRSAYNIFLQAECQKGEKVKMTELGPLWKSISEEEKKGYEDQAEEEKAVYEKEMEAWKKELKKRGIDYKKLMTEDRPMFNKKQIQSFYKLNENIIPFKPGACVKLASFAIENFVREFTADAIEIAKSDKKRGKTLMLDHVLAVFEKFESKYTSLSEIKYIDYLEEYVDYELAENPPKKSSKPKEEGKSKEGKARGRPKKKEESKERSKSADDSEEDNMSKGKRSISRVVLDETDSEVEEDVRGRGRKKSVGTESESKNKKKEERGRKKEKERKVSNSRSKSKGKGKGKKEKGKGSKSKPRSKTPKTPPKSPRRLAPPKSPRALPKSPRVPKSPKAPRSPKPQKPKTKASKKK